MSARLPTLSIRLLLALGLTFLIGQSHTVWAGGESAKKAQLDFRTSYGAAMRESQIRNVPIFFARHKDF